MASSDTVRALDELYKGVTGEELFLYLSSPGDNQHRYAFHSGTVVGERKAEGYMRWALAKAREGKTHSEIVTMGVTSREGVYLYAAH